MAIVSTEYAVQKNILIADDSFKVTLGAKVTNTGLTADSNGKKILKAGTPLYGDITARGTAFVKETTTSNVSNATAVILHDVDVTDGAKNATIVLAGAVDLLKLESAVQTMITADVKAALKNIIFVKGSAI